MNWSLEDDDEEQESYERPFVFPIVKCNEDLDDAVDDNVKDVQDQRFSVQYLHSRSVAQHSSQQDFE